MTEHLQVDELGDPGGMLTDGQRRAFDAIFEVGRLRTSLSTDVGAGTVNAKAAHALGGLGLVTLAPDADNLKAVWVVLTGEGRALHARMHPLPPGPEDGLPPVEDVDPLDFY